MSQRSVRLSVVACALLLATASGCGSEPDDPDSATDPSSTEASPSDSPESPEPDSATDDTGAGDSGAGGELVIGETVEPGQAKVVRVSDVDGETAIRASALVDDKAMDAFLSAADARLAAEVRSAVEAVQVPADSTLFGSVVSVGCDAPTAVTWMTTFDGIEVRPTVPKSGVQCLVPVTSVALFLVPN